MNSTVLEFFVTGNVCKSDVIKSNDLLVFGKVDPGFLMHSINGNLMTNTFMDSSNNVIYTTSQTCKKCS